MAINLIHVSDIHFGSGESHGRLNPASGLNIRFEDFVAALNKVVDYAIENKIDVFLFSGDAYKNATPEPIYQKMFAQALKKLSDAEIKTILVVGNHDQILRANQSHAMSVFQSLAVPGVIMIDKPTLTRIDCANGTLQVIGLPHITRHQLMTQEKYANLPVAQLDAVLVEHTANILTGFYDQLDASLPTVVTAHMTLDRALAGIEQELLIGYTMTFPSDIFIHPKVDYVALGHVHKYQIIQNTNPAIVYAGSLERVDFGEESEDKGFLHVKVARNNTSYKFYSIEPRPFLTVEVNVENEEDPTKTIVEKLNRSVVPGCVLRVRYRATQEQMSLLNESKIRAACQSALTVRLQPEIIPNTNRIRLPQLNESTIASPMVALETYLNEVAPERKETLIARARDIMNEMAAQLENN